MTQVIQSVYKTYMGRAAGAGDIAFGLNLLEQGGSQEQLIAAVLGSNEFYTHEAPLVVGGGATASNTTLVAAMYKQLFPGYTVSQGQVNSLASLLTNGTYTATQLANILDTTSLYRFGLTGAPPTSYNGSVDRAYEQYLGRHASQAEMAYWTSVYAANPTYSDESLISAILNSEEYFLRARTFA